MFKYDANQADDPWADEANKHHSFIADLGEMFDPMSYFNKAIGLGGVDVHKFAKPATTWLNEQVSTISKPINQFMTDITPGKQWIDDNVGIAKWWNDTVENKPIDAAAIAAATLFSGGAAGGAASGAGTSAATSGAMSSAITPAFASSAAPVAASTGAGLSTLGSAGSAYGSALLGGAGSAAAANAAALAGGGLGGLGLTGTQAALAAMTPQLASLGTAGTGLTLSKAMDGVKEGYDYYKKGQDVYDSFNPQQPQQDDQPSNFGMNQANVPINQPLVMNQAPRRSITATQTPNIGNRQGLLNFGAKDSFLNSRRKQLMAQKGLLNNV